MRPHLVDAGPLIGYFNQRDQWHAGSRAALLRIAAPLFTTEIVFAEATHRLGPFPAGRAALLDLVFHGNLQLVPLRPAEIRPLHALLEKYPRMDFGDATLVQLSARFPDSPVITLDRRDFSVYRRARDQPLPLICPPAP